MVLPATLVSIGLPVRNAGSRVAGVVASVLAQDHPAIELVISDNASTDDTEQVCRRLSEQDARIVYHRQPADIGLLDNFVFTIRAATGTYFRWIGDDDRLEPELVSRCLQVFAADPGLLLVTTGVGYAGDEGPEASAKYTPAALGSDDPADRVEELTGLLNASHLLLDPLYAMVRRGPVAAMERINMLREDEVFATRLAIAGPWGHIEDVLAHRVWRQQRMGELARRLGVAPLRSHLANTLQFMAMMRVIREAGELTETQRSRCRRAVRRMYLVRQRRTIAHRCRRVARIVSESFPGR